MFRSEPTIIKTHRKGKRSAFKKFQDSLCLQKKNKKKKKRAKWWVREFGVVVFLVKKILMY
jgi:hypothetical protein